MANDQSASMVAILMCTKNAAPFLTAQLDTILNQDYPNFCLWVSDDGSNDQTLAILAEYQQKFGPERMFIVHGPQKGFAANFMSLVTNPNVQGDFFAFSDQDDIWHRDKLTRGVSALQATKGDKPAIYYARSRLIDSDGNTLGFSPLFTRKPCFANALVQSIGHGNAMLINQPARELLRSASHDIDFVSHDWWAYIMTCAVNGDVVLDPTPTLQYRQHASNLVGLNESWHARFKRVRRTLQGYDRRKNEIHIQALQKTKNALTAKNQKIFNSFCTIHNSWILPRMWHFMRAGIHRQTFFGNLSLLLAVTLKKV